MADRGKGFRPQLRTAPLKRARYRAATRQTTGFRPQLRTAPLKLCHSKRVEFSEARFRPQLRTAPLKHLVRQPVRGIGVQFPSSAEDGSIEASLLMPSPQKSSGFRPQLRTAPLKQLVGPSGGDRRRVSVLS